MGRPKRLYPLGKYRLRTPKTIDKSKTYPIELEYTWNRQVLRKSSNIFVKANDWNQNGNQGRGEIRSSYGNEYKRLNKVLMERVDTMDAMPCGIQCQASESNYCGGDRWLPVTQTIDTKRSR